ncbi:MAG: FeoB small GTPase domain-containing protein, partial [bacterium]
SLAVHSEEERVARDYILSGAADIIVVVCDATCLQRSLHLALQCLTMSANVILCVNLMDEASKNGLELRLDYLSKELQIPVVGCSARKKKSLQPLTDALDSFIPNSSAKLSPLSSREIALRAEELYRNTVSFTDRSKRKTDSFFTGNLLGFVL